jgi:transcriptional regulator of arginine metabolism
MKNGLSTFEKEQLQLTTCLNLINERNYQSQEEIRSDLQRSGFGKISQSTVSKLLKLLGVIKIRNSKGQKIYSVDPQLRPMPGPERQIAEMVTSVEHNNEFILIHTVAGYGRAIARILDHLEIPEIVGVIANSNIVWVAPRHMKYISFVYEKISFIFMKC